MPTPNSERDPAIYEQECALEQLKIDEFYGRLDELKTDVDARLDQSVAAVPAGTPSSIAEHNALVDSLATRKKKLQNIDNRLCFGRLDLDDSTQLYVGRVGLADDSQNPLLIDWRANAASPFYRATQVNSEGVVRRRHIATTGRQVTNIDDDVLNLEALRDQGLVNVVGNDSLLASLNESRTNHMRDIVSTIQSEQDHIIRAPLKGTLVVQGGPGTGKTVVALHRVAYLLYEYHRQIERSGVLVIGPNRIFLDYIDQVLPALGETGVNSTTIDRLIPQIEPRLEDDPASAIVKGSAQMSAVLKALVSSRQSVPSAAIPLSIDGTVIELDPEDVKASRRRAKDTGKPHNEAWKVFAKDLLNRLARKLAAELSIELDDYTRAELVADLREFKDVRREINLCWMPQDPQLLLHRLFTDRDLIEQVCATLKKSERELLYSPSRTNPNEWSPSDIPLIDELYELLGSFAGSADSQTDRDSTRYDLEMARRALDVSGPVAQMLRPEDLVSKYQPTDELGQHRNPAEDRSWIYGHVVVDEAQELSPMAWRMIFRRCPSKSVTVVGDPAQTSSPAGISSWGQALDPFVGDRWSKKDLTVNYRTPRNIMECAEKVLDQFDISCEPSSSVREGVWKIETYSVYGESESEIASALANEAALIGHGTIAVVSSENHKELAQGAIEIFNKELKSQAGTSSVEISAKTPRETKGLEFDAVVILEPKAIIESSLRPGQDLFVAMTRPTQKLAFIESRGLPSQLLIALSDEGS